jgi:ribosomal protein S11
VEKGFTFNYDGSLIDFKKPKVVKELESAAQYEVNNETLVKEALGKNAHKKKTATNTGFGAGRLTQTDYGNEKISEKQGTHYSRQNTQKETPNAAGFNTET